MKTLAASLIVLLGPPAASIAWGADAPVVSARTLDLRSPGLRFIYAAESAPYRDPEDMAEAEPLKIVAPALPAESGAFAHLSRTGLGSVYWLLQHPKQAWRVLLPVPQGMAPALSADMRTMCEAVDAGQPGAPCA